MSKQPKDDGGNVIPVLGLRKAGGMIVPFTTSANTSPALSGHTSVVSVHSTVACFIETGDANVVANVSNSHFVPANASMDLSVDTDSSVKTHFSVIGTEAGILYLSERE